MHYLTIGYEILTTDWGEPRAVDKTNKTDLLMSKHYLYPSPQVKGAHNKQMSFLHYFEENRTVLGQSE